MIARGASGAKKKVTKPHEAKRVCSRTERDRLGPKTGEHESITKIHDSADCGEIKGFNI